MKCRYFWYMKKRVLKLNHTTSLSSLYVSTLNIVVQFIAHAQKTIEVLHISDKLASDPLGQ